MSEFRSCLVLCCYEIISSITLWSSNLDTFDSTGSCVQNFSLSKSNNLLLTAFMAGLQQFDLDASASLKDSWFFFSPVWIPIPSPPFYPWISWQQLHLPPDSARGCSINTQWAPRLLPAATFCIPLYLPPHWVTRTPRSTSQAIYRGTQTLSHPWQFFSWCIPCVRMSSLCSKHRALLVLSAACATFSKRGLHSAPSSMEHCALFHWILSHFCTLILRVTQFCISSFCVFMNPLNLASLAKFYQHTPNFCTKTINRNTK